MAHTSDFAQRPRVDLGDVRSWTSARSMCLDHIKICFTNVHFSSSPCVDHFVVHALVDISFQHGSHCARIKLERTSFLYVHHAVRSHLVNARPVPHDNVFARPGRALTYTISQVTSRQKPRDKFILRLETHDKLIARFFHYILLC